MSVQTVKEITTNLNNYYVNDDELIITYWAREDIRERFLENEEVVMTDEAWNVFKEVLGHYTKNNELSSDLIDEVVSNVVNKLDLPTYDEEADDDNS